MDIFNGYLEGEERELAIENARLQNEFDKLHTMLEMVGLHHQQMLRDAEFKVFSEGGTYDDFEYLISEANEETQKQQEGILTKLFTAIETLITGILDTITRVFTGKRVNDQEVRQATPEQQENLGKFDQLKLNAQNVINSIMRGNFGETLEYLKKALPWVVPTTVAGAAVTHIIKKHAPQVTGAEANADADTSKSLAEQLRSAIKFIDKKIKSYAPNSKEEEDGRTLLTAVQNILFIIKNAVSDIISLFGDTLGAALGAAGDAVQAGAEKAAGVIKGNGQPQQQQTQESTEEISREESIFGALFAESRIEEPAEDSDDVFAAFADLIG